MFFCEWPKWIGEGNVLELEKKPSGTDDNFKKGSDDESEFALHRVPGTVVSFGRWTKWKWHYSYIEHA
jgi:hypothetical protein